MRIGIIGAGQLGQMLGFAARELGVECRFLDPSDAPPAAAQVQFTLVYSNAGGLENDVMIRNEFPAEAPYASSVPAADRQDPARAQAVAATVMQRRGCRLTSGHEAVFRTLSGGTMQPA